MQLVTGAFNRCCHPAARELSASEINDQGFLFVSEVKEEHWASAFTKKQRLALFMWQRGRGNLLQSSAAYEADNQTLPGGGDAAALFEDIL